MAFSFSKETHGSHGGPNPSPTRHLQKNASRGINPMGDFCRAMAFPAPLGNRDFRDAEPWNIIDKED
jgi:hypothetical protein